MKSFNILILVLILLIYSSSFSQEQLMQEEITLYVEGFTSWPTVTYTLEAVGTVWANATISTAFNTVEEVVTGNTTYNMHYGWRIFWETAQHEPFAHGFYKLKTNINSNYIYLDFRDCQFANESYTPWYSPTDFFLKYNGLTDEFSYANSDPTDFTTILAKAVVRIGDIKNGNAVTTCFDNYWSNCLVLIPSPTGNHPRLVWGPYPENVDITCYRVYRKTGSSSFTLIHTTANETTFEYTDEEYCISSGIGQSLQYYVKALYSTEQISNPTNTVSAQAISLEKINYDLEHTPKDFALYQNYPNPFNPSTTIKFALPVKTNLSLSVYNTLGEKVAEIFKGEMEEGYHEMMFNASGLSSGVYFYKIESENFNTIKKLMLLK